MTQHEADRPPPRALLVEDGAVDRLVAEMVLKRLGYDPRTAVTLQAALEAWDAEPFALALLDMHLPDGEGWDLAAELRRREAPGRRTPIVALSATAEPEDRERCLQAGADAYLAKPVGPAALAEVLARVA